MQVACKKNSSFGMVALSLTLAVSVFIGGCGGRKNKAPDYLVPPTAEEIAQMQAREEARKKAAMEEALAKKREEIKKRKEEYEAKLAKRCRSGAIALIELRSPDELPYANANGEILYEGLMGCIKDRSKYYQYYILFSEPLTEGAIGDVETTRRQPFFAVGYTLKAAREALAALKKQQKDAEAAAKKKEDEKSNKKKPKRPDSSKTDTKKTDAPSFSKK